jgi:PAS domain S-box-containing protein
MSVRALLVVTIGTLALLALAISGTIIFRLVTSIQADAIRELDRTSEDIGYSINHELGSFANVVTALMTFDGHRDGDIEKSYHKAVEVSRQIGIHFVLRHVRRNEPLFNTAFPWGTPPPRGLAFPMDDSVQAALLNGRPVLSDVYFGPQTKRNMIINCVPSRESDTIEYALCAIVDVALFAEILKRSRLRDDSVVTIIDRAGTIVARSKDHGKFNGTPAAALDLIEPGIASAVIRHANAEGVPFVWASRRLDRSGWIVRVGIPQRVIDEPMFLGAGGVLVAGFVTIFGAVILGHRAGSPIARSVKELRDAVSHVRLEPAPQAAARKASYREISQVLAAASEELLTVADRRSYVLSAAEVGTWEWDNSTGKGLWSNRYREIIGVSAAVEPCQENFLDRVHPADRPSVTAALMQHITDGQDYDRAYRILRADTGEERWVHAKARVERDRLGRPWRVIGVGIDITAHKRAEQEFHDTAARLRALVETVADGVILIDERGQILLFNPACERLFGYRAAEIAGENIGLLMPPPHRDAHDSYISDYRRTGNRKVIGAEREVSARRRDGTEFAVMLSVGEVKREEDSLFIGIIHDLTMRKRAQQERDELRRRLMRAQEDERLRLAHELHDETGQELAAAMLGLKRLEPVVGAEGRDLLDRLRAQLDHMGKSLHRVARELRPTSIDDLGLARVLADHCADWQERFGINVDYQCVNVDLDTLPGDLRSGIYRICQEALTNVARHATGATDVGIIIDRIENTLRLTIEDNGCGFDPNAVGRPHGTGRAGGLGLAGIRERLALMGGEVEIESSIGVGTTIFMRMTLSTTEAVS